MKAVEDIKIEEHDLEADTQTCDSNDDLVGGISFDDGVGNVASPRTPVTIKFRKDDAQINSDLIKKSDAKNRSKTPEIQCQKDSTANHDFVDVDHCTDKENDHEVGYTDEENEANDDDISCSNSMDSGKCTFKCPESNCSNPTFQTWESLTKHKKKYHNITPKMSYHEKYSLKTAFHICKICSKTVLCDTSFLINHIRKHGLSLNLYREKYATVDNWMITDKELLSRGKMSKELKSLCRFKCPHCGKNIKTFYQLKYHAKNICKHAPYDVRSSELSRFLVKIVTYKCKLCSKLILCDTTLFKNHISAEHDISKVAEYPERTEGSGNKFKKYSEPEIKDLLNDAKMSEEVGNLCKFECDKCDYVSTTWCFMREHLRKANHCPSFRDRKWFKYVSETVLHKCVICEQVQVCDRDFLRKHLVQEHKITVPEYVKKFKLKSLRM